MRAEILVGRERRRRWSADDKLQIVREAFAPGARVALVARRRDVSRSQIYQWRAALREGRLSESGGEVVGFVPVEMAPTTSGAPSVAPNSPLPAMDSFAVSTIEIGLPGGRSLKVPASLPSTELRRLIRTVEGA
jgi:transposase